MNSCQNRHRHTNTIKKVITYLPNQIGDFIRYK